VRFPGNWKKDENNGTLTLRSLTVEAPRKRTFVRSRWSSQSPAAHGTFQILDLPRRHPRALSASIPRNTSRGDRHPLRNHKLFH
jgi:hypothetical protein